MQTYVWGILISAFLLDIWKNNYREEQIEEIAHQKETLHQKYESPPRHRNIPPVEDSGIKVKLDGEQDLKVEYEGSQGKINPRMNNLPDTLRMKILYCTS